MTATKTKAVLAMTALGVLLTARLLVAGNDPPRPHAPVSKSAPPAPEKEADPKGRDKPVLALEGHQYGAQIIELIEGGKSVLTADLKGNVRIVDAATGREQRSFRTISCFSAKLSPDAQYLAVGGWKEVALYELKEGKEIWKAKWQAEGSSGQTRGIGFSADGRQVVCGDMGGFLRVWETETGKLAGEVSKKRPVLQREVVALTVQPGGTLVAYGAHEFVASPPNKVVDTITLKLRDLKSGREEELAVEDVSGKAFWGVVTALTFSPDGRRVAAAIQVGLKKDPVTDKHVSELRVWDVATRREILRFAEPQTWVAEVAFSPDGRSLACLTWDGTVSLCEVATGQVRREIQVGANNLGNALTFTLDGRRLWTGIGQPRIWSVTAAPTDAAPADPKDLWADLASEDAVRAFKAVRALIADPQQSVPFLDKQVRAVKLDEARVKQLVTDLGDEQFSVREDAAKELKKLGELTLPYLRKALANETRPEAAQRLKDILAAGTRGTIRSPEALRIIRAIEAIEYASTPEAVRVLKSLAKDIPDTWAGTEAKPAVERLRARR